MQAVRLVWTVFFMVLTGEHNIRESRRLSKEWVRCRCYDGFTGEP